MDSIDYGLESKFSSDLTCKRVAPDNSKPVINYSRGMSARTSLSCNLSAIVFRPFNFSSSGYNYDDITLRFYLNGPQPSQPIAYEITVHPLEDAKYPSRVIHLQTGKETLDFSLGQLAGIQERIESLLQPRLEALAQHAIDCSYDD